MAHETSPLQSRLSHVSPILCFSRASTPQTLSTYCDVTRHQDIVLTSTHVKLSGVDDVELVPLVSLLDDDIPFLDLLAGDDSHHIGHLFLAQVLEQENVLDGHMGHGPCRRPSQKKSY